MDISIEKLIANGLESVQQNGRSGSIGSGTDDISKTNLIVNYLPQTMYVKFLGKLLCKF